MNQITGKNQSIEQLHEIMAGMPQDTTSRVEHEFCDGMYQRKFFINKDVLVMSRKHRKDYLFIIAKGKVAINDTAIEQGKIYEAGDSFIARKGAKRVVYALEDSIIISVHRTNKHNLVKIEKELVEFNEFDLFDVNDQIKDRQLNEEKRKLLINNNYNAIGGN